MTTPDGNRNESIGRRKSNTLPEGGYEWTCPYCGQSRLNTADGDDGEKNAIIALRTHIVASDRSGHGPRNEFPPDESPTLSDYVRAVESRR